MKKLNGIMGFKKSGKPSICLTGALGFVASNVAQRLKEKGYDSYNLDNLAFGSEKNAVGEWHKHGFQDLTEDQLSEFDILVHMATSNIIFAMSEPIQTFKTNALDTINLFNKFKGKIVYTSTASVYGQATILPTPETAEPNVSNAYDQSKLISELFLRQRGNYTTLRLSNVFGINQRPGAFCGVVGKMLGNALNGNPIEIIGDGLQTRDFTYADDVADAIELAINQEPKNTEINIATGQETSMVGLISAIRALGYDVPAKSIPLRSIDSLTRRCLDISKAEKLLGWKPKTSLKDGLIKTIEWIKTENLRDEIHKHLSSTHSVRIESDEAARDRIRTLAGTTGIEGIHD